MLRFSSFLTCVLMSLGIQAQEPRNPANAVAYGVSLSKMCGYASGKIAADKNGEPKLDPLKKEEKTASEKFSLQLIFKAGRYQLTPGENVSLPDGRPAQLIRFAPWPKKRQLEASPEEDKDYMRVMNQLSGEIFIDPATGGIMKITASLTEPLPYFRTWLNIKFFELQSITATLDQRFDGQKWVPTQVEAKVKFWRLTGLYMNVHDRYLARFDCK